MDISPVYTDRPLQSKKHSAGINKIVTRILSFPVGQLRPFSAHFCRDMYIEANNTCTQMLVLIKICESGHSIASYKLYTCSTNTSI